jgi:hypothetical protein
MTAVEGLRPLPVSHVLNFAKTVLNGPSRLLTPSGEASRAQLYPVTVHCCHGRFRVSNFAQTPSSHASKVQVF